MQEQYTTPKTETSTNLQQTVQNDEETIDLVELFYALLDKWRYIAAATVLCALVAGLAVAFFVTPKYKATATIYVLGRSDSVLNVSDLNLGSALASDYIKVFDMWEVHEQVISNLSLPYSYTEISNMLTVENDSNTRMIDISVTSTSAEEAAQIANEYADVAAQYIADTMKTDKPTTMSTALAPQSPVSPNKTRAILIAALVGFVASAGVFTVLFLVDDTYKSSEDIKKYTGLATLAAIPLETGAAGARAGQSSGKKKVQQSFAQKNTAGGQAK